MKRLCIYVVFDTDNIVDDYIGFVLKELKRITTELVIVCNMDYVKEGKENLEAADAVYFRKNVGLDAGAFKDALCNYIGWKKVLTYDQLLLVNDSFFGPFIPFTEIFDDMERKELNFWGLSKHLRAGYYKSNGEWNSVPEHLQSYFLVIGRSMLHDERFVDYWNRLPYFESFSEVVEQHEKKFTQHFSKLGYKYDSYTDNETNRTMNEADNYIQYAYIPNELIEKRKCPVIKRKPLMTYTLYLRTQENIERAMNIVEKKTSYNVGLIWRYLIRKADVNALNRCHHLSFILDTYEKTTEKKKDYKIVIIVKAENRNSFEFVKEKLEYVRSSCRVIIFANKELGAIYKKEGYEVQENISVEEGGILVNELANNDYLLAIHDCDMEISRTKRYCGRTVFFNIWDNLLYDEEYIHKVIDLFDNKNYIGALMPPKLIHDKYFINTYDAWNGQYNQVMQVLEKLDIRVPINFAEGPCVSSSNYWIRCDLLRKIIIRFEYNAMSFSLFDPIIEKSMVYIAQAEGCLCGTLESEESASINGINRAYFLQKIGQWINKGYGETNDLSEFRDRIYKGAIAYYLLNHQKVYCYGIGYMTDINVECIDMIEGFIVSDGQNKPDNYKGRPVYYLSEVNYSEGTGVIVCLGDSNYSQVKTKLFEKGFFDHIVIGD